MKLRLQFGGLLIALGISAAMALPCAAQNRNANRPPQQQQKPATHPAPKPERRQEAPRAPQGGRANANRPANYAPPNRQGESAGQRNEGNRPANRPGENGRQPNFNPNRPPNATVRQRDLTPKQRENLDKFNRLSPQEQQKIREGERVWRQLTPEQQNHIRNDVLPTWKQLPSGRQKAISNRLSVLQNMPESARNQHLNDPNFTRGMSEEDKAMLRDLAHMHVGAPDQPNE